MFLLFYFRSVGVSTTQPEHLKFIYENHEDFSVIPSFIVQTAMNGTMGSLSPENGLNIDPTQVRTYSSHCAVFMLFTFVFCDVIVAIFRSCMVSNTWSCFDRSRRVVLSYHVPPLLMSWTRDAERSF